jgi:hypothetical protein
VLVPALERIRKDMELHMSQIKDNPELHRAVHVKLIDEAQAPDLKWLVERPLAQQQFKQWIKDRNIPVFTPEELADFKAKGVEPDSVIALTEDPNTPHPGLYYWGQKFRAWTTINYFVQATKIAREIYPPHIGTTQNFSDALVGGNIYSQGNDYWMYYRDEKALDVLQTEDWCNGASTRQSAGWNAILARSATKYHGQPLHMYVIAASGRRPLEAKLKAFSTIAQGNKFLNYYTYNPKYKAEEIGWSERPDMIVGLAELSREIGAAEHVLMDAMPRTAETAIIYSVPTDIWTLGQSGSQTTERLYTFYALRHAQVPVDVLCDDDITAGYLKHYKVAYLFGEQITAKNLQPLADWVKAGGTLVLSPAAGTRDEYNRVNQTLDTAFGFQRGETALKGPITAGGIFLHRRNTTGDVAVKVRVGENTFPAWGETQVVPKVGGMTVEATFEDGSPAAATYAVGQGKVVLRGFLPGVTYVDVAYKQLMETAENPVAPPMNVAKAMVAVDPKQPRDWKEVRITQRANRGALPYAFDLRLLPLIASPALEKIAKPVALDAPIVEATFMEGKTGWIIPLANYSGSYIDKLTVTINPGKPFGVVKSSHHGELKTEKQSDGSIKLAIPLESTDFVYAEWAK